MKGGTSQCEKKKKNRTKQIPLGKTVASTHLKSTCAMMEVEATETPLSPRTGSHIEQKTGNLGPESSS